MSDERDAGAVEKYLDALDRWQTPEGAGGVGAGELDADWIERARQDRLSAMRQVLENGEGAHPDLLPFSRYVAADMAALERPAPHQENYSLFLARRMATREKMLDGAGEAIGADAYVESCRKIAWAIREERGIPEQYDILAVRREAALEHFDDPRFIARIATAHPDHVDEMLVDFDIRDAQDADAPVGAVRDPEVERSVIASEERAQAFLSVAYRADKKMGDKGRSGVHHFMEMSEAAAQIRHDQRAIATFASWSVDADGGVPKVGADQFEMGMLALEGPEKGNGAIEGWIEGLSIEEKKKLKEDNSATAFYRMARSKFLDQYGAQPPSRDMLKSFAVMERAANIILKSDGTIQKLARDASPGEVGDLALFRPDYKERISSLAARWIDEPVGKKIAKNGPGVKREGTIEGDGAEKPYEVDLARNSKTLEIRVLDGGRLRVSNTPEDMEKGLFADVRIDGMLAPPEGTLTRNGNLDAGQEAKAHLETLVARHGASALSIVASDEEPGAEASARVRLNGEDLGQRMIRDGYAVPSGEGPGKVRKQEVARQAEAGGRGLWRDGFADVDESWRPENASPALSERDRKQRLTSLVGASMSASSEQVERMLSHRETKIFALPVQKWSTLPVTDERIEKIAKRNPGRLKRIVEENDIILTDLRKRKSKLTSDEKRAHDRLTLGSQALLRGLHATGHISDEQAKKGDHPLLSEKARSMDLEKYRRPIARGLQRTGEVVEEVVEKGSQPVKRALGAVLDQAMD